ncbi:MAG: hypothetical protein IT285_04715 [Bdellovibrionales bacterium]|nr:hypothetical protein [Bdellovibrionales bacterium]
MALQPFSIVPRLRFYPRWALVVSPLLIVGFFGVGIAAKVPPFASRVETPNGVEYLGEEVAWVESWWPPTVARNHYHRVLSYAWNFPEVCWPGREINDFQTKQCAQFRERMILGAGLCLLPLIVLLLALMNGGGKLTLLYRKGWSSLTKGRPLAQAVVTDPPEAGTDFFSWLFCLQGVSLQLPDGRQVVASIDSETPIPLPGQKFLVYDLGQYFGKPRYVGLLHAPHLAVVAGSR